MAKKKTPRRTAPSKTDYFASIYPGKPEHEFLYPEFALPDGLVDAVRSMEAELKMPVWLLIQDAPILARGSGWEDSPNMIGDVVAQAFFNARFSDLVRGERVAIVLDSGGGDASAAYAIAMLLRRHCGGFVVIIPRHAKSAATLLSLGADAIIMNDHAELGPLDVQIWDPDREAILSGLDEVQALERLQAFAMESMDRLMMLLLDRTKKKIKTLLPPVTEFVTKLTHPMYQGIDVVRYTQMSRLLKVAEAYGQRLLRRDYGDNAAEKIASKLVTDYPEHGFPIYPDEAREIGLKIAPTTAGLKNSLDQLSQFLPGLNAIGTLTA